MDIYRTPILTARDAARHLGMPDRTLDAWLADQDGVTLVHSVSPEVRGGPRVPFVGVVEAFVLRGLRELGFTKVRIREAARLIRAEFDDEYGLASQRIDTDGVELFVRLAHDSRVAVRDGQRPIEEVLDGFLKDIHWDDSGRPQFLRLEQYSAGATVIIDPRFAWGAPVLEGSKIPVQSLTDLWRAGESITTVAHEFGLSPDVVEGVCRVAA